MHEARPELVNVPEPQINILPDIGAYLAHGQEPVSQEITPLREYIEGVVLAPLLEAQKQEDQLAKKNAQLILLHFKSRHQKKHGRRAPVLRLPTSWLKLAIKEGFDQNPFQSIQSLSVDIEGEEIPISYSSFDSVGRTNELTKAYNEVLDEYLTTFDRALAFITSPIFSKYGGWSRIQRWHKEFVERAFEQNPFMAPSQLALYHEGQKFLCPYRYYEQTGREEEFMEMYKETIKAYANKSHKTAEELIFQDNFQRLGGWELVDEEYQKNFTKKAFEQNPFTEHKYLKYTKNGKSVGIPLCYYCRKGNGEKITQWIREIMCKYLENDFERVIAFLTNGRFHANGGWATIPKKWRKVLITKAVLQSDRVVADSLQYQHGDITIRLNGLYRHYRKSENPEEFATTLERAKTAKKNLKRRLDVQSAPQPADQIEEGIMLGIRAEEGDQEAVVLLIETVRNILIGLSRKYAFNDTEFQELAAEGTDFMIRKVKSYKYEYANNYAIYIGGYLKSFLRETAYAMRRARTARENKNHLKNHRQYSAVTGTLHYRLEVSPEKIAELTGKQTKTVVAHLQHQTSKVVSLDDPLSNENTADTRHTVIADTQNEPTVEIADIGILEQLIETLPIRNQIAIIQYYGLTNRQNRTIEELTTACTNRQTEKTTNIESTAISVLEKFLGIIRTICENSTSELQAMLDENPSPNEILNGSKTLGQALKGDIETSPRLNAIFTHALSMMEDSEMILLSELFQITPPKTHTFDAIGEFLNTTKQGIKWIFKEKILPILAKRLRTRHNITKISDLLTPAQAVSPAEYFL